MRCLRFAITVALIGVVATLAGASDLPIKGGLLKLQEKSPALRKFFFRTSKEAQISLATIGDPTVTGATIEVFGSGAGDGNTGVVMLPAAFWRGTGRPAGSNGFVYVDHAATLGVTRFLLRRSNVGGTVAIAARGTNWPYQLTQPQADITVRLTVGANRFCARFPFVATQNLPTKVLRLHAAPPPSC